MAELSDLEARIRVLEDREAIKELKYSYWYCIDRGLWDKMGDVFAEDAWADFNPDLKFRGRDVIANFFRDAIAPAYSLCMHMGHNGKIALTSDTTATGLWELDNYMVPLEGDAAWIGAYYEDEYVKVNGEWKIQSTIIVYKFNKPYDQAWATK
jgi:hypothetical protein